MTTGNAPIHHHCDILRTIYADVGERAITPPIGSL